MGSAQATSSDFYTGKTVRIIVGFTAGGGYDMYARLIARHLGKHIPGRPAVIVENMTGAGSLIAANHLYRVAKPDGLTLGHFSGVLFMGQLLGRPGIEFDARKFEHIGAPVQEIPACALTKASGINDLDAWMASKTPVKLGGTGPGALTDVVPRILMAALGLPIRLIPGYRGTAEMRLAAEAGEIEGGCWTWISIKATWSKAIGTGQAAVVLQIVPQPHPDLPHVPLALNVARTDEARQLIDVGIHDQAKMMRTLVLPPGTSKERVEVLRRAFMDTMEDPGFLAEARKSNLDISPVPGEEIETTVARLFELSPPLVARLREVLGAK